MFSLRSKTAFVLLREIVHARLRQITLFDMVVGHDTLLLGYQLTRILWCWF